MRAAGPYEEQESPGGKPATTTALVTSALVTPTLATSPARRCWSPALRPASGRHLHWPTPRRNAASRCITIQVGENLAKTIRNGGGEVFPVQGDISIPADVERVVEDSAQQFGRLDGLVNNAASAACLSRTDRGALRRGPQRPLRADRITPGDAMAEAPGRLHRQYLVDRGTQWRRRRRRPLWLGSSPM